MLDDLLVWWWGVSANSMSLTREMGKCIGVNICAKKSQNNSGLNKRECIYLYAIYS